MKEPQMELIADYIAIVLNNINDKNILIEINNKVKEFISNYPL
jgi:glycine/serine hydroxymethyltransferase